MLIILAMLILLTVLLIDYLGIKKQTEQTEIRDDFAMDTLIHQAIYGKDSKNAAQRIIDQIQKLDQNILSRYAAGSDIGKINAAAGRGEAVKVDEATLRYLKMAVEFAQKSGGAFNPAIGPLTSEWNFKKENPVVPQKSRISELRELTDYNDILLGTSTVRLKKEGESIDLGAVGKGIACDEAKGILESDKDSLSGAIISVGGSVLVWGQKPGAKDWTVAVRDPLGEANDTVGKLSLSNVIVSTSGSYERYFEVDGIRYHHILDPKTGHPADSDLVSVTVVSPTGFQSDMLSTACFVLGYEKSLSLLQSYDSEAMFITSDKKILFTGDLKQKFELTNTNYYIED